MNIIYLAKLARLKLTDAEKERFSSQIGTIIKYIEKLDELDTQNIQHTAHVLGLKNIFRDDMAMEPLTDHDPINDSPAHSKGHYEVPKII